MLAAAVSATGLARQEERIEGFCKLVRDDRECQEMRCDMSCTGILYGLGTQNGSDKVL